jgi:serine phosphatase RsbU (regulator of sigma subunit)
MRHLLFILFLLITNTLCCQINELGFPYLKNYTPHIYHASNYNWAVIQDIRGVLYFANSNGILEYDGIEWRLIPVGENTLIRSFAINEDGQIYVGADSELGYLSPNSEGNLHYQTLTNLIDTSKYRIDDIWRTYALYDNVYFSSKKYVFHYKNNSIKIITLPKTSFFTFVIQNKLVLGSFYKGLMEYVPNLHEVVDDSITNFKICPGGEFYEGKYIINVLSYNDKEWIIFTYNNGIFLYDYKKGVSEPLNSIELYKGKGIYQAVELENNFYALSTLYDGLNIINNSGSIVYNISKKNGLLNEVFTFAFNNFENQLWLTGTSGISRIDFNNPIKKHKERKHIYSIIRYRDTLFLSVEDIGFSYLKSEETENPFFEEIPNLEKLNSDSFFKYGDKLLISTKNGICEKSEKGYKIVNKDYNTIYNQSIIDTNQFLIGNDSSLAFIKCENDNWLVSREIYSEEDLEFEIYSLEEGVDNIWILFYDSERVVKIDKKDLSVKIINTIDSTTTIDNVDIISLNNNIIFSTEEGFYQYDNDFDRFILLKDFLDNIFSGYRIERILPKNDTVIWAIISNNDYSNSLVEIVNSNGIYLFNDISIPFKRFPFLEFNTVYHDEKNITWIGTNLGLFSFDNNYTKEYDYKYKVLIRKVSIASDSIIFRGTNFEYELPDSNIKIVNFQPIHLMHEISYQYNSLTFHFAYPFYEDEEKTKFSWRIKELENNWNEWTLENKAKYINFHEGNYTFQVKAMNVYGIKSDITEYKFKINPPFYRTIYAYLGYLIIFIVFLRAVIKLNIRRLEKDKDQLEKTVLERTAEIRQANEEIITQNEKIVDQRDEIEAQHKMVVEQKNKLEKINIEVSQSIYYAQRIQSSLLSDDNIIRENISDYFVLFKPKDIVSGDFFWWGLQEGHLIITAADCTGHGVPGAFMSMLGISFLREIILKEYITHPGVILRKLRKEVIKSLKQKGDFGEQKDGMDLALISINKETNLIQYAGANNPLYIISKDDIKLETAEIKIVNIESNQQKLYEIKPDKMPIGIYQKMNKFECHDIQLKKGDQLYMFSDGFADQFGGPLGKKFMYKPFKNLLLENADKPMSEQKIILEKAFEDWKGDVEQIDDVVVLGIKV